MQIKDLIPWGRDKDEVSRRSDDKENPLINLQRDINRVFDNFWNRFERPFGGSNGFLSVGTPSTDVSDSDDAIEISVELPGMDEKDIEVSLSRDVLTIRGEKKAEKEEKKKGFYLSERSYGAFYRSVPLPPGVDTEQTKAEFKQGVLTITLPKTAEAQAEVKRIEVKAN
jgi:HSP20 family protein|tara:strand:+ start:912 stop:1418 length:507 start_codon:yes stop_codon:yes gene_type:complete